MLFLFYLICLQRDPRRNIRTNGNADSPNPPDQPLTPLSEVFHNNDDSSDAPDQPLTRPCTVCHGNDDNTDDIDTLERKRRFCEVLST